MSSKKSRKGDVSKKKRAKLKAKEEAKAKKAKKAKKKAALKKKEKERAKITAKLKAKAKAKKTKAAKAKKRAEQDAVRSTAVASATLKAAPPMPEPAAAAPTEETYAVLRARARDLRVPNYSRMSKVELQRRLADRGA